MAPHPDAGPLEDVNHPIPRLDTLDTLLETEKGAYVGIVIASPLKDDEYSRARLRRKLDVALGYFLSKDYLARWGAPQPERSRLYLDIHARSDPQMLLLVEHHCAEIAACGVTPKVTFITPDRCAC